MEGLNGCFHECHLRDCLFGDAVTQLSTSDRSTTLLLASNSGDNGVRARFSVPRSIDSGVVGGGGGGGESGDIGSVRCDDRFGVNRIDCVCLNVAAAAAMVLLLLLAAEERRSDCGACRR